MRTFGPEERNDVLAVILGNCRTPARAPRSADLERTQVHHEAPVLSQELSRRHGQGARDYRDGEDSDELPWRSRSCRLSEPRNHDQRDKRSVECDALRQRRNDVASITTAVSRAAAAHSPPADGG